MCGRSRSTSPRATARRQHSVNRIRPSGSAARPARAASGCRPGDMNPNSSRLPRRCPHRLPSLIRGPAGPHVEERAQAVCHVLRPDHDDVVVHRAGNFEQADVGPGPVDAEGDVRRRSPGPLPWHRRASWRGRHGSRGYTGPNQDRG